MKQAVDILERLSAIEVRGAEDSWEEVKHPRDKDGKFKKGNGASEASNKPKDKFDDAGLQERYDKYLNGRDWKKEPFGIYGKKAAMLGAMMFKLTNDIYDGLEKVDRLVKKGHEGDKFYNDANNAVNRDMNDKKEIENALDDILADYAEEHNDAPNEAKMALRRRVGNNIANAEKRVNEAFAKLDNIDRKMEKATGEEFDRLREERKKIREE